MEAENNPKGNSSDTEKEVIARMRDQVIELTKHDTRKMGSIGHDEARVFLLEELTRAGAKPYTGSSFELDYEGSGIKFTNIIGRVHGRSDNKGAILIGAHYDTVPNSPGADDNAAAIAITLKTAQDIREAGIEKDLVLAFFDAEEPPHFLSNTMGSIQFYNHQQKGDIDCAIVLDLVGHDSNLKGCENALILTGLESHKSLEKSVQQAQSSENLRIITLPPGYIGEVGDYHIFKLNRKPYLFMTCGPWQHYHSATDTPDKLNFGKMAAISRYLSNLVIQLDALDISRKEEA